MNIDEAIAAARKMESRELDAYVAEHVMGYRWIRFCRNGYLVRGYFAELVLSRVGLGFEPGRKLEGGEDEIDIYSLTDHVRESCPKFSSEPAADFSVLVKVRETWAAERRFEFQDKADEIWNERNEASGIDALEAAWWLYEVGDYSLAAAARVLREAANK